MSYEIETIDKNPKSCAAWKREAERLQAIIDSMALAAMDSEPVAEVLSRRPSNDTSTIDRALPVGTQIYRHAQPATVVPTFDEWLEIRGSKPLGWVKDAMRESYDACRAAMLQAGTLTNEDTRQVDELTMWIKRLVRSLKNANPDSKLPREAMDYLTAKGLISVGDILR